MEELWTTLVRHEILELFEEYTGTADSPLKAEDVDWDALTDEIRFVLERARRKWA